MVVKGWHARPLVDGTADGFALVTDMPLSFWGGVDPETGRIIDNRHPLVGELLTGRILVLPSGRGSCSASGVLLESISNGTAPAGIVVSEIDPILGLGSILGEELLTRIVPVVLLPEADRAAIRSGSAIRILRGGFIEVDEDPDDESSGPFGFSSSTLP
jgi:predicted aconitase with swiveling domain